MSFPESGRALASIWPQEFVDRDSLATLGMDLTAPFLLDMGLGTPGTDGLREIVRGGVDRDPRVLVIGGANEAEVAAWLGNLDSDLRERLSGALRQRFWEWVRDTLTRVPADRPNWEMYEVFFFRWSVGMRDGDDTVGCFEDGRAVYETYRAFTLGRRLADRIRESRSREISAWDKKVFSICGYSLSTSDVNHETVLDPFGVAVATASRNYFQQFWEYLLPRMSEEEQERLHRALQERYSKDFRARQLVPPGALATSVR